MGRARVRLSCFNVGHSATTGVKVRSPSLLSKPASNSIQYVKKNEFLSNDGDEEDFKCNKKRKDEDKSGNKIMVVVDSSPEAKGALEWALSQTVQSQDILVLVHVATAKQGIESNGRLNLKGYELLHTMKSTCQTKRPGVLVEVVLLEGKKKGEVIVEEVKQQKASLLVIGQRKRLRWWCLVKGLSRKYRRSICEVDYCIQNASCMTIAVRRNNRRLGGYLITTKRHKNFWLLA